ncbi:radical SAM protein [Paenibacillus sp. FSL P4-0338]|uniref:radical SAM/SPASM domain-containing protein n=1 Tax=Paenibacillus sp. FSL P4-0338 TaxID=2921635 RepID=UPI0030F51865
MLIGIWVTKACNLRCSYCYEGNDKKEIYMDRNTADQIINFIQENYSTNDNWSEDPLIIQFHGGEPLLNYDLITYITERLKLLFATYKKKVMFGITTNAVLLDKKKIEFLAENMNYDFSISIDGDKKVHDQTRLFSNGTGSYDAIINKVNMTLEKRKNIRARVTFGAQTVSHLFESIKHLIELGFLVIVCIPDYFDKSWDEKHIDAYLDQLGLLKEYYLRNRLDEKNVEIPILENNIFKKNKCSGGYSSIHIDPTGEIYPCSYVVGDTKYKIGSVHLGGINNDYLADISRINDCNMIECEGCNNYSSCLTVRCRYLNELLTDDGLCPSATICAFENANYSFIKSV